MIRKQVTLNQLQVVLERLPGHMERSVKDMLEYYMQKIIIRHFQFGNASAYKYPALSPKYVERKRKKWGNQPQLVASGLLRESVTTLYKIYRIRNKFRIVMKIPGYGKYVKDIRDFTIINRKDMKDLLRYYDTALKKHRKLGVSSLPMKRK
jgi:hypothetical protein